MQPQDKLTVQIIQISDGINMYAVMLNRDFNTPMGSTLERGYYLGGEKLFNMNAPLIPGQYKLYEGAVFLLYMG